MSSDTAGASGSQVAAGRARVAHARRFVAVAAVGAFGVGVLLVRAVHPAATAPAAPTTPSSLAAEVNGGVLGGGSIGPATGAPGASTATS